MKNYERKTQSLQQKQTLLFEKEVKTITRQIQGLSNGKTLTNETETVITERKQNEISITEKITHEFEQQMKTFEDYIMWEHWRIVYGKLGTAMWKKDCETFHMVVNQLPQKGIASYSHLPYDTALIKFRQDWVKEVTEVNQIAPLPKITLDDVMCSKQFKIKTIQVLRHYEAFFRPECRFPLIVGTWYKIGSNLVLGIYKYLQQQKKDANELTLQKFPSWIITAILNYDDNEWEIFLKRYKLQYEYTINEAKYFVANSYFCTPSSPEGIKQINKRLLNKLPPVEEIQNVRKKGRFAFKNFLQPWFQNNNHLFLGVSLFHIKNYIMKADTIPGFAAKNGDSVYLIDKIYEAIYNLEKLNSPLEIVFNSIHTIQRLMLYPQITISEMKSWIIQKITFEDPVNILLPHRDSFLPLNGIFIPGMWNWNLENLIQQSLLNQDPTHLSLSEQKYVCISTPNQHQILLVLPEYWLSNIWSPHHPNRVILANNFQLSFQQRKKNPQIFKLSKEIKQVNENGEIIYIHLPLVEYNLLEHYKKELDEFQKILPNYVNSQQLYIKGFSLDNEQQQPNSSSTCSVASVSCSTFHVLT